MPSIKKTPQEIEDLMGKAADDTLDHNGSFYAKTYSSVDAARISAVGEMLAIVRKVAEQYESEQAHGGPFPDGRTWLCIPHNMGQASRAALKKAGV